MAKFSDQRGDLGISEFFLEKHFLAKRVYYITNVRNGERRGLHAHKELEQIFYCLKGEFSLLVDDGKQKETVVVRELECGYYLRAGLWREMYDFSPDAVCMVIASAPHDAQDYLYDYMTFKEWVNG